ncbi:MAG: efflux RND transporter periplasmic adaptor subunit [Spirochaetota bacterium]
MKNNNLESNIADTLGIDQSSKRRKGLKRWLIIGSLTIAGAIIFLIISKSGKSDSIQYKTEEVKRGNFIVQVTATGTLQPTNEVTVSTELSGVIKIVYVDYNDKVKVGQILARLDTSKLEAQVTQYKAALESARAKVLEAQATVNETRAKFEQYKKVRELSNNKVPSQSDMGTAEASFERAKAQEASYKASVAQAKANLDAIETDLSKSVIRSPINGIVLTRSIEPGQTVAAAMSAPTLFTLAEDLKQMELQVNVDEADVGKVKAGQKATFTVAAHPNRTFNAWISEVHYGSSTTSGVVTYTTVLKVNNSDLSLRPGMTATADIVVKNIKNTMLVPGTALRFSPPVQEEKKPSAPSESSLVSSLLPRPPGNKSGQKPDSTANKKEQRVWILRDSKLIAIPVTVGSTNGTMTEVVSGNIKEGMLVVTDTITSGI